MSAAGSTSQAPLNSASQAIDDNLQKAGNSTKKVLKQSQTEGTKRPPLNRFTTSHENVLHNNFLGSIDQGTTSTRFIIFDGVGEPVAMHQVEFTQQYPQSGWHEHDPEEIIETVHECIEEATKKFTQMGHKVDDIKAIGITNQRETALVWDRETGKPLHNAIAWPDTRTKGLVRELKAKKGEKDLSQVTGLPLSTYPASVKLVWLLRNCPEVQKAYEEGRLCFGTVDTWIIYRLNGGKERNVHVTDSTNASRTMFMNLHTLKYDDGMLEFFEIDKNKVHLPKIVPSSCAESYGSVAYGPLKGMKIAGCLGDQSSALVGQQGFTPGSAKSTYGTGCFLLYNVGEKPVISTHGLLATVAYDFGRNRKPVYALEGSVAVAGSGVKFLMNNMGFITHSHKISDLAASVDDNGGCVFVTAFSGLFAPYWIDDAKGTIFGITQHTQRGHIARATLEATCFQTKAILDAMEKDSGHKLSEIAVDGGMSNSNICMQTQANISGIPVNRPAMRETTALGAAIAAGFAVDIWKEFSELKAINQKDRKIFEPDITPEESEKMYKKWARAVNMSKGWLDAADQSGDF
ncbi:Glycerol kinase [Zalaria obscura]|uniref:Glycerol kinase n=1 Tax=Zalaria obscura TaxID=2024903 RepID=A0ACC3SJP4_9PEZI